MNYCTVQEAWGKENYISNQYKNFNHNKKPIEKFSNHKKMFIILRMGNVFGG